MKKIFNPANEYVGRLEDFPLESLPDYEPGKPPKAEIAHEISYLEEYERIWDKPWGSQGIGKLREIGLIRPIEQEVNPLWEKAPEYFYLKRIGTGELDLERMQEAIEDLAEIFKSEGVQVDWMKIEKTWGAYGPLRKMFIGAFPFVVKGGAIIGRTGQSLCARGFAYNFVKFFNEIGCPILHMIHGKGVCEIGCFIPVAEDVIMGFLSVASNQDAIDQVMPVFNRSGVKEVHISHLPTVYESLESGGEFHLDMIFGVVDLGLAVIYPACLDYQTYRWLREKKIKLIEVPRIEHEKYFPCNLVILEPGKVLMPAGAKETIRKVRKEGVEVVEFESSGLMVGVNGIHCVVNHLIRDSGPSLEEIKR